jgi:ABC-type multidrug transport system fused ATPase/permease subunit
VIGDRDARDWDPVALRQAIGYAPQEALLLSGTLRENIRFGRAWISEEDLSLAVETSQLAGDLAIWPQGLETVIGARGIRLSGGQKQRVALARALAGRPQVLLLDDCTASLDAQTEEAVWNCLASAMPGCTTILVTHRPATLRLADQIVVLDGGHVREVGNFDELNRRQSLFHELYVQWKLREEVK